MPEQVVKPLRKLTRFVLTWICALINLLCASMLHAKHACAHAQTITSVTLLSTSQNIGGSYGTVICPMHLFLCRHCRCVYTGYVICCVSPSFLLFHVLYICFRAPSRRLLPASLRCNVDMNGSSHYFSCQVPLCPVIARSVTRRRPMETPSKKMDCRRHVHLLGRLWHEEHHHAVLQGRRAPP